MAKNAVQGFSVPKSTCRAQPLHRTPDWVYTDTSGYLNRHSATEVCRAARWGGGEEDMPGVRMHVTLGAGRVSMLRHRAGELGVPPARLAAQMIDQAVDRLASDEAFLTRWENAAKRRAEERKLKAWEGRT